MIKGYARNEEAIEKEGATGARFHSLAPGRTVLRILPPYSERGVWFRSVLEYYIRLGDETRVLISPKDAGLRDPLSEYGESLSQSGDERLVEKSKSIRPRRRFLVNALVVSDPKGTSLKDGVKVVNLPVRVKEDLRNIDTDVQSGYGNITDLEGGFNVTVERSGEGLQTRYAVRAHRERSNILEQAHEQGLNPDGWSLFNLDDCAKPSTERELQEIVDRIERDLQHSAPVGTLKAEQREILHSDSPIVSRTVTMVSDAPAPPKMPFSVPPPRTRGSD